MSSPMFSGPSLIHGPVTPFGGKGGGGGGGGASEVHMTLSFPGDDTTERLLPLSQQAPLLNVENLQPLCHHSGLRHTAQQPSMLVPPV